MAYGTIKVDQVTFTNGGVDQTISVSGIVQSISGDITATGTIQGATIIGTSTVSGATVTGDAGQFINATAATGVFTSTLSGATITGNTASFTTITGGTVTLTSGVFASGTAAAPSVSVGTTDNGLYSPGADQVAISTNGTGRLFVGSDGKIGIGNTVASSMVGDGITIGTGVSGQASVCTVYSNSDTYGALYFADATSGAGRYAGGVEYVHSSDVLNFYTNSGERLRILSDGKLGLGTSSPNYQLHVTTDFAVGASGFNQQLTFSNDTIQSLLLGTGYTALKLNPLGGNVGIGTTSATQLLTLEHPTDNDGIRLYNRVFTAGSRSRIGFNALNSYSSTSVNAAIDAILVSNGNTATELAFSTAGNNNLNSAGLIERARIDSSGRLLVGTSSSTNVNTRAVFQGYGASANEYAIVCLKRGDDPSVAGSGLGLLSFGDKDADNVASIGAYRDTGTWTHDVSEPTRLVFSTTADGSASPTERMRIDSSGRVGIGTIVPDSPLQVIGSTSAHFKRTDNGTSSILITGNDKQWSLGVHSDDYFRISREGVGERLRIDSSGRLLVGTSTSDEVGASIGSVLQVEHTSTINAGLTISCKTNTGGGGILALANKHSGTACSSGDSLGRIGFAGHDGTDTQNRGAQILAEADGNWANDDTPGRLVFSTTADGASSPTERMRIDNAGTTTLTSAAAIAPFIAKISTTEAARIDSSGRLLVGTSTALSISSGHIIQAADSTGVKLTLGRSATSVSSGLVLASLNGYSNGGSVYEESANIQIWSDGDHASGDKPGRLVFSTTADGASSPTERMRITNSGVHHMFGATGVCYARSATGAGTAERFFIGYHSATGATTGGTISFNVYTNGDVTNTNNSYGSLSDIKLKENIVDANSQWDDLKALQVRNYNFKEGQTHTQIGLVAQEVELVSPGLVSESPDRDEDGNDLGTVTKSVNYSVLYMKAVKALQEAMERIEVLEQRLNDAGIA